MTSAVDDTSTGTTASSESTAGPPLADPCLEFSPGPCPPECVSIPAYAEWIDSCPETRYPLESTVDLCVTPGEPAGGRTSFFVDFDDQTFYALVGHGCAQSISTRPALWSECSASDGEPPGCECLCGSSGCPHLDEFMMLEDCGLPTPCGEPVVHEYFEGYTDYDRCVLEALRDRVPGRYYLLKRGLLVIDQVIAYVGEGEEHQLLYQVSTDAGCFTLFADEWDPARTGPLRPPAWFDDCLQATELDVQYHQCLMGPSWFESSEVQPAVCP